MEVAAARYPLVLHGGSGTSNEDLAAAIEAGMTVVHINTEIRLAWRGGVERGLATDPGEVTPYKILAPVAAEISNVVAARLFARFGRG
jgi:fructose-bisphosphate aldolase, class II